MNQLQAFRAWLTSNHYSTATIRNYLVDINKFLLFSNNSKSPFLSEEALSNYLTSLSNDNNQKRYLASLNSFCQFAVDQQIITNNPLIKIRRRLRENKQPNHVIDLNTLCRQFSEHLSHQQNSPSTIRNYINDINQYISWVTKFDSGSK